MKGLTNVWLAGDVYGEKVYITLQTNQSSHEDIVGAVVTVGYDDVLEEYVWDGQTFSVVVPPGRECTVSFSAVEGYQSPDSVVFDAVDDNSREVSVQYRTEVLTVNVTSDEGSVSGYTVEVAPKILLGANGEYTRLEYIKSTGTQYIDTGFVANQDTSIETEILIPHIYNFNNYILGSATSGSSNCFTFYCSDDDLYLTGYDDSTNSIGAAYDHSGKILLNKDKGVTKINGEILRDDTSADGFTCPSSLYVGAAYIGGTVNCGTARFYSFRVFDNGTLVRDFVPVMNSGGVAGFYDVLNDRFYTSAGDKEFVGGSELRQTGNVQTSSSATYKIPYGVPYVVSASGLSGYSSPSEQSFTASVPYRTVTLEYGSGDSVDLSMQDIFGNPVAQTTANCYVVSKPGIYKFPLVYGCAIKNGADNPDSYTESSGGYTVPFATHVGSKISGPYIEPLVGSAVKVQLTIADTDKVFSGLGIVEGENCRYVQFRVEQVPETGANGVISIKNATGVIMWSWLVWVWKEDLTPVTITNLAGYNYDILPVDLASKRDDDMVHVKSWLYQWGRPIPIICASSYNSTVFHASYGELEYAEEDRAKAMYMGIQRPNVFYYTSSYPWFPTNSLQYYHLWDAGCSATGNSDNDVIKTVYDPCPPGFKMPNGNAFSYFSADNSIGGFNEGWKFKRNEVDTEGVFFPTTGYAQGKLTLYNPGTSGYRILSSSNSTSYAYCLTFSSTSVNISSNGGKGRAYPVRPVAE